jgi:hypothetical protein
MVRLPNQEALAAWWIEKPTYDSIGCDSVPTSAAAAISLLS